MTPEDRALLDRIDLLHSTLTQRTVLLSHFQSNMDIFIERMRDLGQDFHDLGTEILQRVTELDALPIPPPQRGNRSAHLAGRLAELGISRNRS